MKTIEEHKTHFKERLLERYGLTISDDEYFSLRNGFVGLFVKRYDFCVGYVIIQDVKVWVLYGKETKIMHTCYPSNIGYEMEGTIKACFSRPIRHLAFWVYEQYLTEKKSVPFNFETQKDAAIYYFKHTMFPDAHIRQYRGEQPNVFRLANHIRNILYNKSKFAVLNLQVNNCRLADSGCESHG